VAAAATLRSDPWRSIGLGAAVLAVRVGWGRLGGMETPIERVMVVTAHPDDSEFGAAGTVARLAREGKEITYVIVTDGSKGSSDRTMAPARLVAIRAEEQRNAARTLGVERVEFLGYVDCELEDTRDLRQGPRPIRELVQR